MMLAIIEEEWFPSGGTSNMANPVANNPKGFDLDDRTMLLEICERMGGLTLLVEVAWENHRALYGPWGDGRHTSSAREIERVRRPMGHEQGASEDRP